MKKQNSNWTPPAKKSTSIRPMCRWPQELPGKVLTWFQGRGITGEVLLRNKIGHENGWIQFPFIRSGEVINVKYRNGEKQFRQVKGAEKVLYGLDDLNAEMTVIVEGEMDKLALEVAEVPNAVSVPDGAPAAGTKNYSSKFDFLETCKTALDSVKRFVIAVDSDGPGKVLEQELARRLGYGRCFRVVWPEGSKDANAVLLRHGAEFLGDCIDEAQPFPLEGVYFGLQLDLETLFKDGHLPGLDPGWISLEKYYTISRECGELNIVTGIPGHGKSEFIDALMVNLAEEQGWSFGVFSPENFPLESHAAKLIEKHVRLPFRDGFKRRMTLEQMKAGQQWVHEHFYFILPKEDNLSLDSILEAARGLVFRFGIKGLVVDPWNEIDHSRDARLSETEYISQSLTKLRRFARNHSCHVWLVAHPTKLHKQTDGKYPPPTPYDISGSAHWRNKADNCLTVYRNLPSDDPNCPVEIHVQKIRKKHQGQIGVCKLHYQYSTGRYTEPEQSG
ncbi:MAG: DnaB-like helicase C-terminal domain-containing protein [Nitrospinaceae bacterium]